MPNFSSKILGNSVSALVAQQALIANTSNNIANVNTPGFTRREIALLNRADAAAVQTSLSFGSGVDVGTIRRITSSFLETAVRDAASRQGMANVSNDYLGRIENLFSLTGPQPTVGSTLNEFFSALNTVAVNPSSLDDRLVLMQRGEDLVNSIKTTYNTIATTQTELDYQVPQEITQINEYTKQIAALNDLIKKRQASNSPAVDEQDQRDGLMTKLAEKITFQALELENGTMNISLANGFPLVSGTTARQLEVTASPSFGGATLPPSLEGRTLSYIVYNFGSDTAPSHLDLTKTIKGGMGSLGGILQLRGYADVTNTTAFQADGDLVAIAQRIEALTMSLLTDVNETYLGPDEDSTTTGLQSSAGDLNGNAPDVFGLFDFDFSGVKDSDGDGVPSAADLLATGMTHFSDYLKFSIQTPDRFAAARDNDTTEGIAVFPQGDGQNAAAVAALKQEVRTFTTTGGFSLTGTFDELYSSTVNYVGSVKSKAETDVAVAKASQASAQQKRDELSAVSLDEEFANLIKYQKAFQASARIIKTASDMLDQLVALI
jgi:flagellar hook-associated protein 1 FlgK